MASYYYLVSSLPMLTADSEMPFGYEAFLDMCRGTVSGAALQRLEGLTTDSDEGPLIAEWAEFYGMLAKELANQRNARLGRPTEPVPGCDEETVRTVTAALNAKNPLEAEQLLLTLQFARLDELVGMHYFDDYVLNGYALKLKLLERRTAFDKTRGREEFNRLLGHVQQQILTM